MFLNLGQTWKFLTLGSFCVLLNIVQYVLNKPSLSKEINLTSVQKKRKCRSNGSK